MIIHHHHCVVRRRRRPWIIGTFLILGAAGFVYSTPWAGAAVGVVVGVWAYHLGKEHR